MAKKAKKIQNLTEDTAVSKLKEEYGFPPYDLMAYQKRMIRDAIEHILTYDTLEGMKDK